jgi:hypothetical protein
MGKFAEFEVTTSFTIIDSDFTRDVPTIGFNAFKGVAEEIGRQKNIRMWKSGENYLSKDSKITVVPPDKIKYYHVSRVANAVGVTALDFYNTAVFLDPKFIAEGTESPSDLHTTSSKQLEEDLGLTGIGGTTHEFDYVDMTVSAKYPGETVFVLRKLPSDTRDTLQIISDHARSRLEQTSQIVYELNAPVDGLTTHGIEDSVPFARTKINDPELLKAFVATFSANFFDPSVRLQAGELDITTST